jgi:hypothetical protein
MRPAVLSFLPSARTAVLLMAAAIAIAVAVVVSVLAVPKPADAATEVVTGPSATPTLSLSPHLVTKVRPRLTPHLSLPPSP